MSTSRSLLLGTAFTLMAPLATGCVLTKGIVDVVTPNNHYVSTQLFTVQTLKTERTVVRADYKSADAEGVLLRMEQRQVCPQASLYRDHYASTLDSGATTYNPDTVWSLLALAGEVYGTGSLVAALAITGEQDDFITPNDYAARMNGSLAVWAASVVVGSSLSVISNNVRPRRWRTEYTDEWCGEWSEIPDGGDWTAVTTTVAVGGGSIDSDSWDPTKAELKSRQRQIRGRLRAGLARRIGTAVGSPTLKRILPPAPYALAPDERHPWLTHLASGTQLSAETWRVPAASLAPHAWNALLNGNDDATTAKAVLVVNNDNRLSGGASALEVDPTDLVKYAPAWACETASWPKVATLLAARNDDDVAAALTPVVKACPDRAGNLKVEFCARSAASAEKANWRLILPTSALVDRVVALCGPNDWNRAAWRNLNGMMAAKEWAAARNLLITHRALLGMAGPKVLTAAAGYVAVADADRVITEGVIEADINAYQTTLTKFSAYGALGERLTAHAGSFPERAAWIATQRKAASALVLERQQNRLDDEDWAQARELAQAAKPLMGAAWTASTTSRVDKLEAAADARQAAARRREEAAERREEAAERREESSGGRCHVWYYPSIRECGMIYAGRNECGHSPSFLANSVCRNAAIAGESCRCP